MKLFNFKKRSIEANQDITDDLLLKSILSENTIGKAEALNIPAVARCVNLISDTVAMIPIKLYKEEIVNGKRKTVEIEDSRCDFSWLLFVETKMLGFTEREVGHFTLKKLSLLYRHFRGYHDFCIKQGLFKEEKGVNSSDEWLKD